MTRLGFNRKEVRHMYLSEFTDKYRTYKKLFNLEKECVYKLDFEPPAKISSLRDF